MTDKDYTDIQTKILKEQIKTFQSQFEELDRLNVRTIPENMFIHHFLPFFSGEVKENSQEIMTNWLTIAGSAVNPVNIVNSLGQVVAQVPPVQNNDALDPMAKSDTNIAYTAKEAKAMSSLSPIAAQNILGNELNTKLKSMTTGIDKSNIEHENKWNALLAHYNKSPINAQSNPKNKNEEGDIFGF